MDGLAWDRQNATNGNSGGTPRYTCPTVRINLQTAERAWREQTQEQILDNAMMR
jgi:hypothetical protein